MPQLSIKVMSFAQRITGCSCDFIFDTEKHPYSGGECTIFALDANGRRIGVRVQRNFCSAIRVKVEAEIQYLQAITRERIPYLPYLIGYDLDSTPPMIATSWANGKELKWTDASPPLNIRRNILKTIAGVTLDMLKIQEPGGSALKWITDKIQRTRIDRAIKGAIPGISSHACEALLHRIFDFHLPEFNNAPRVLVHGDLQAPNIIVNQQNVEGIIDLGFASMIPLQFAPVYPRFLVNEPRLKQDQYDWSECAYSQVQKDDRSFYLQCIIDLAPSKGENARIYSEILARDDQEERYWWFAAAGYLDIMRALQTKPGNVVSSGLP